MGDDDELSALVAAGAPVDELFDIALDPGARREPATPLMVAAGSGDGATARTVQMLIDLGASLARGPSGVSALWYSCHGLGWNYRPGGDADRVRALLAAGADPTIARPGAGPFAGGGVSALAGAAAAGDPERVRLLLDAGADPAPVGAVPAYEVPLRRAAASGSAECVRLLLAAGAPVDHPVGERDEPLVASAGSLEVLAELLSAGADPHAACRHGRPVAGLVARTRTSVPERVAMLELLVDAGVDLNAGRTTALFDVAMVADPQAVEALLAAGANPHQEPTPLGAVCFLFSWERNARIERVVDLLVGAGVDPDAPDNNGFRPLHGALSPDRFGAGYRESDGFNAAAALALIGHGVSVEVADPDSGNRPLHAAAAAGNDIVVEALLAAGANPSELSVAGDTPLDLARRAIATHPADTDRPDHTIRREQARRCITMLEAAT